MGSVPLGHGLKCPCGLQAQHALRQPTDRTPRPNAGPLLESLCDAVIGVGRPQIVTVASHALVHICRHNNNVKAKQLSQNGAKQNGCPPRKGGGGGGGGQSQGAHMSSLKQSICTIGRHGNSYCLRQRKEVDPRITFALVSVAPE